MKFAPAFTVVGPVFVTSTSACSATVVLTCAPTLLPSLLVASGSAVAAVACATLFSVPATGAVTVTVYTTVWPLVNVTIGHVTVPPDSFPPSVELT